MSTAVPTTRTLSEQLAEFAITIRNGALPASVANDVPLRILDTVGNALGALGADAGNDNSPGAIVRKLLTLRGGGGAASVFGSTGLLPAASAAFVNGTLCHALDFDDTHLPSIVHPSASVVPAVLAVAEAVASTGAEVLSAVAVGLEICDRLGMASYSEELRNSVLFHNGLHATSIFGTVASAAAAAMLLGGNAADVTNAMAIACSMGAGIIEANRTGGSVKRVHCGWAAQSGITAAELAIAGLTGPPTALEGRFGLYRALSEDFLDADALVGQLGSRWEMLRTFYKPYPCNHFTHAGIDAARELRRMGVDPSKITTLHLGLPGPVIRTIGEPIEEKIRPQTGYHAKFSGPYTVAAALVGGSVLGLGLDDFTDECLQNQALMGLAAKVTIAEDTECSTVFPRQFPAVLRATLTDGSSTEVRVMVNRGGPENPLSSEELLMKFQSNATQSLPDEQARELGHTIVAVGDAGSLEPMMSVLRSAQASK